LTLLAAVSDRVRPRERPQAVGLYRFWRDFGFVAGTLIAGFVVVASTPWSAPARLRPQPAE
jgi:MFS family permease